MTINCEEPTYMPHFCPCYYTRS